MENTKSGPRIIKTPAKKAFRAGKADTPVLDGHGNAALVRAAGQAGLEDRERPIGVEVPSGTARLCIVRDLPRSAGAGGQKPGGSGSKASKEAPSKVMEKPLVESGPKRDVDRGKPPKIETLKGAAKEPVKARDKKEEQAAAVAQGPKCDLYAAQKTSLTAIISYTLLAAVLFLGWLYRGEEIFTAKEGTGYIIGIVGASMMLLLVLYPIRKTARFMRRMGAVKHWFRAHMVLGLIGPALILFHSNFALGSLNSSVALVAMLLVAVSGLIGRYIYSGIHYGLYGKEMNLNELQKDFKDKSHAMGYVLDYAPAIQERILNFDNMALRPHYSFVGSLLWLGVTFFSALRLRVALAMVLRRTLRVAAKRNKWTPSELRAHDRATRLYIANHISSAMAISRFKVYERLFSLWHLLHLPLFIMLVLTAIIHVVAVHMF